MNNKIITANIQVNINSNGSGMSMGKGEEIVEEDETDELTGNVSATNALYQFLKNKQMSKEIQNRTQIQER